MSSGSSNVPHFKRGALQLVNGSGFECGSIGMQLPFVAFRKSIVVKQYFFVRYLLYSYIFKPDF